MLKILKYTISSLKKRYNIIIVLLLLSFGANAQPSETTYLGTIIKEGTANNVAYGPFNIGFNFTFYGTVYTQFYVSSNGLVTFGSGSNVNAEETIPSANDPDNYIAPFWDDLVIDGFGDILYTIIGAAPNRKLIVQFRNMGFYPSPVYMGTFSVVLYETTNKIQSQYRMVVLKNNDQAKGGSATIGIENIDGSSGVLYAYHNINAISTGKAISYTPAGLTYTLNSDEIYDGIYLTKNLALPEPGISELSSPANGSTIGVSVTFEWSEASYATSYFLRLATNPSMTGATTYNAGSALTYSLAGLTPGITYYWTIIASNATGFTWNEVKNFTTSSNPPLAAVSATVYVEQSQEKTIKLNYTGGDASAKTAIITSIPAQGQLYQYNAGVKGDLIPAPSTTVTDPGRNVIYVANGTSGNGAGNFSYIMHDDTGDSPAAQITVNVSPPGIPNLLYVAKSTTIEMQFDRIMANPGGKEAEFTATVNGTPVAVTSLSLKTGDPYSIIATLATPLAGGETVLIAYTAGTIVSAQGGWLASFTNQTVTLTAQTISFAQTLDKKYNESPFTLTASAPGGSMTYSSSNLSIATIAGSTVTLKAIGSSDITARQAGNATYAPAKYIRTMTVAKGDQTITFSALPNKTYGDADFTLSAVAGSLLLVAYTSDNTAVATVTGNTVHIVGGGTAVITATQAGNTLWNAATPVPQTLTVDKANQTISFSPLLNRTYGDSDFSLSAVAGSALLVAFASDNPAVATVTGNTVHIVGAGTTIITASQAGNANYNAAADVQQTLTVNKANQTITFEPLLEKDFGTPDYSLFGSSGSGLPVSYVSGNTAVATVTGNTVHIVSVGTTVITASQPGDANYNAAADVPQTLTVNTANATVTLGNLTTTYNGLPQAVTATTVPAGLTVDIVYDGSATQPVNAGTYTVAAAINDPSYNGSAAGTFTIEKATQTITFSALQNKTYGDGDFTVTAVAGSLLLVTFASDDETVATVAGNMIHIVGAGTANITAMQPGDGNYNAAPEVVQTLTVNKADQTITFPSLPNMTFGDGDYTAAAVAGSLLLVAYTSDNPAVATVTGSTVHIVGAGSATITASQTGDGNYNAANDVAQILSVDKADQTITFAALQNRTYGDGDFTVTAVAGSLLLVEFASDNPAVATVTGNTVHIVGAGTATITASQSGGANYNAAPDVQQMLTVDKAGQSITFSALTSKTYGDSDFTVTAVAGSLLLVTFASDNTAVATVTGNTIHITGGGTTTITASQGGDANYLPAVSVQQTLTVNKAGQTISWVNSPEKLLIGEEYTLEAVSTAGLGVLFESLDNNIATVTGAIITGVTDGTVQIRAYNAGDQNYNTAEAFVNTDVYSTHKDIMHLFTPNNDGINDLWELPELAVWGKCDVRVFNRWGKLVFADADYNNLWDGRSDGKALPEGAYFFIIKSENAGMIKGTVNIVR